MIWKTDSGNRKNTPVVKFLENAAALIARLILLDVQSQARPPNGADDAPEMFSPPWFEPFSKIFGEKQEYGLNRVLRAACWDLEVVMAAPYRSFLNAPSHGLEAVSRSITLALDRNPLDLEQLTNLFRTAQLLLDRWKHFNSGERDNGPLDIPSCDIPRATFSLFRDVDTKLQDMISKQTSSLTVENLTHLINNVSNLLCTTLYSNSALGDHMVPEGFDLEIEGEGLGASKGSTEDRIILIDAAWRMELLRKCIVHGRMDARITGVESMQATLVSFHGRYIQHRPKNHPPHPVVEYLTDFILKSRLVHYLVGVESHPQIIFRSKNIVGFLVVTQKYTNEQTDIIWNSVLSSQDPRAVEAILEMLKGITELFTSPLPLVYFCQKVAGLPVSHFDNKMMMFSAMLAGTLIRLWRPPTHPNVVDLTPFKSMIRILRQSTAEPGLAIGRRRELYIFAKQELCRLATCNIDQDDELAMYRDALADIKAGNAAAAASVTIVVVLLNGHRETEGIRLRQGFNFTSLLVDDMSHLRRLEEVSGIDFHEFPDLLGDRLNMIEKLVVHLPDSLSPPLLQQLWSSLVGEHALSNNARDMAWNCLAKAAQQAHRRNSFLDACLHELVPGLNPEFLTIGVLDFANQLTEYDARINNPLFVETAPASDAIRAEIFRHIALRVSKAEIGVRATSFFVKFNLEDVRTRGLRTNVSPERQKKLVDSCVEDLQMAATKLKRQLDGSTSGGEDSMVVVPSDGDISATKVKFTRTLAILREFLQGVRTHSSPPPQIIPLSQPHPPAPEDGEIRIGYQPQVGGKRTGMFSLNIAETSTIGELAGRLRSSTGFSEFTVIAGGSRINLEAQKDRLLREMQQQLSALVLVQKIPGSRSFQGNGAVSRLLPVETEIMSHFHEFYDFLSLDEDLGNDVFTFLTAFPPHADIMTSVASPDRTWLDIFPPNAPYKTMYSVCALKGVLSQALQEGAPCQELVHRGVRLLGNALVHLDVSEEAAVSGTNGLVMQALTECLHLFLKEPSSEAMSNTSFEDPGAVVNRLKDLTLQALQDITPDVNSKIACACFGSILEASLHSEPVWNIVKQDGSISLLLEKLWLQAPREDVRRACVDALKSILSSLNPAGLGGPAGFTSFFWNHLVALIPRAIEKRYRSRQFWEVAAEVFRKLDGDTRNQLPLRSYVLQWTELLLTIEHRDFRPLPSIEADIAGLSDLTFWCISFWKARKEPLDIPGELVEKLFGRHLFPAVLVRESDSPIDPRVPVLDSKARASLYGLVLSMTTNLSSCQKILTMTRDLVPQTEPNYAWSDGAAQIHEGFRDMGWNFDRWKAIRSLTGYAGLKNLSNTCYINSLLTQLFMNARFRDFMVSTHLTDPENSQKLLYETKKLFAYMQQTWLKGVDPTNVIKTIVPYDSNEIDVTIQMDVDEFYNLLFDRWESQIPSDQAKKEFRSLYGGHLVQQIKSRDCPHVSEREEPFSAIQCEIQGKTGLVDSLSAYVEGEMMEGDNKYSCGSCGTYVNAIKRACLKDLPDNLIFHLKRFDYDLMTGIRNKINDHFDFPKDIDMTPYTVDYLKDPSQKLEPDQFTLVGVLVHSGNAEAGHYFSYIRERPHSGDSWVEFNDADVTPFEQAEIRAQCFGGVNEYIFNGQMCKSWSAYMLFYQRVSSMETEEAMHKLCRKLYPVKVDVPASLTNRINTENEHWLRKFCLFDPEHARFSKEMLELYRDFTKNTCTDDHVVEGDVIKFIIQHLEKIFVRQKDLFYLHAVLDILNRMVDRCQFCCRHFLNGVLGNEVTLKAFLIRCPDESMRRKTSAMITSALRQLRRRDPRLYGIDTDSEGDSPLELAPPGTPHFTLHQAVEALKGFQQVIFSNWKAWDDYFGLLANIASLGAFECVALHENEFLSYCLEILIVDTEKHMTKYWPNMNTYVRLAEKRRFSLRRLVALVQTLLSQVRLELDLSSSSDDSQFGPPLRVVPTNTEVTLLKWPVSNNERRREDRGITFLDRVFKVDNVDLGVCQELVRVLVRLFNEKDVHRGILAAIHQGCTIEPAVLAKPHLSAALAFCETVPEPSLARQAMERFAREVSSINSSGGEEHIDFFERARRISNEHFSVTKAMFFKSECMRLAPFWAPHLLIYPDAAVRQRTIALLEVLIFGYDTMQMDDEEFAEKIDLAGRGVLEGCVDVIRNLLKTSKPIEVGRVEDFSGVVQRCLDKYLTEDDNEHTNPVFMQAHRKLFPSS